MVTEFQMEKKHTLELVVTSFQILDKGASGIMKRDVLIEYGETKRKIM